MIFAGLPVAIHESGIGFVTTLIAPTIELFPIETPFKIIDRLPIHTLSPIETAWHAPQLRFRVAGDIS
jgi:hypothetical protein